ncbi:MAG: hypothetical protein JXR85_04230 [Deltaproteobacteria bacterium]|nr:hypothetical protein [Deltaproteobacteria bacterium]
MFRSHISESERDSLLTLQFLIEGDETEPGVIVVMRYLNGKAAMDSIKTLDPLQYIIPINDDPM